MTMALCSICQEFDIRSPLLSALESKDNIVDWGNDDVFHSPLKQIVKYHNDFYALRASAQSGCELCGIVWQGVQEIEKSIGEQRSDEELAKLFDGEIYFGTDGRSTGSNTKITVTSSRRDLQLCALDVYAKRDHVPEDQPDILALLSRDIHSDSSSPACLLVGAEWLKSCRETHPECAPQHKQSHLPSRVINVGDDSTNPFLHISDPREVGSWVALSYCWGGPSEFILTNGRLGEFQRGLPLDKFPRTIRDAILVTRALGEKYLWVDALCILQPPFQGDTNPSQDNKQRSDEDWAVEAPKMAEIYRNAVVTITATASPSVKSGILGKQEPSSSCRLSWRIPLGSPTGHTSSGVEAQQGSPVVYVSNEREPWKDVLAIKESHWHSRGWTMQEGLLASRTLAFTSRQIVWECSSSWIVESQCSRPAIGNANLFADLNMIAMERSTLVHDELGRKRDNRLKREAYNLWYQIVTLYSQRNLGNHEDKFPAIAGLAKRVKLALNDDYCVGLWRKDLLLGLLWYDVSNSSEPLDAYLGPSWTWAGISSKSIQWKGDSIEKYEVLAEIENVYIKNHSLDDIYGRVEHAKLEITAPYYRLENLNTMASQVSGAEPESFQAFINQIFDKLDSEGSREYHMGHKPYDGQHFAILQIIAYHSREIHEPAMELLLLESDSGGDNLYRRIGQVSLRKAESGRIDPEARPDYFNIGPVEDAAWREVQQSIWESKTVFVI